MVIVVKILCNAVGLLMHAHCICHQVVLSVAGQTTIMFSRREGSHKHAVVYCWLHSVMPLINED